MTPEEKEILERTLFESIWIERYSTKTELYSKVLKAPEATAIVESIFKNLEDAGFQIIKK